jgi:hypothetical protein
LSGSIGLCSNSRRRGHKEEIEKQRKESEEKMDKLLQQLRGKAAN